MNVRIAKRAAAVIGVAVAMGFSLLGTSAQADPVPDEFRQFAGVGSDTTQDVVNGLGNGAGSGAAVDPIFDPDGDPSPNLIASYNAVLPGSTTITTRDGVPTCTNITRPNGSSAGINALNADINAGTHCIDFARSSRGPNVTSTSDLTWIPFATDAVTWAVRSDSPLAQAGLTKTQLQDIYNCRTTSVNTPEGPVAVSPLVPQAGSGTRSYWATEMNINATNLPACVHDTNGGVSVQEHDGSALQTIGDIMPYSIAQYLAQTNHAQTGVTDRRHDAVLRPVNGTQPVVSGKLNTGFPITRPVYNVVETARLSEDDVQYAFVGSGSEVCNHSATIELFGFAQNANCGNTDLKGDS